MLLPISLVFTALSAFLFVALSVYVIQNRVRVKVGFGDGDDKHLESAIRAHGNFGEYTPFAIALIVLCEMGGANSVWLAALAGGFFVGRFFHAFSLLYAEKVLSTIRFRQLGMGLTFLVLAFCAVTALYIAF